MKHTCYEHDRSTAPAPGAQRSAGWIAVLRIWFAAGCVLCALFPAARTMDPWIGWLPFWLVVAPALDLLVLRRSAFFNAANVRSAARWVTRLARRRRRQAQPLQWRGARRRRVATVSGGSTLRT